ncbi:heavy metal-binding domain-containing protein [Flavobacteriaceae sp. LMIT009]|jgi:hypothetical protein
MKKPILILSLFLSFAVVFTSCKGEKKQEHSEEVEMHESNAADAADIAMNYDYQCPMDCEDGKTYSEEGDCPKCKMALKKVEKEGRDNDQGHEEDDDSEAEHDSDHADEH